MGAGEGEIHPPPAGAGEVVSLNAGNYRITDTDRIGEGGLKQKYRQNLAAIRAVRQIQAEARPATTEEKAVIAKYVGWGGLPQVFATPADAPQWRAEQEELAGLLEPDELSSARATVLNAHYTSPTVIRAMYAALDRLGFKHGRVLEPACGLGHFFGVMPDAMAARSHLTGVEIDPLTARLAQALYPDADIRSQAFENVTLPTNAFDLAVSNVPFGDYSPFDPKLNPRKFPIHDYYFVAAAERVRTGGLVAFVTSRGTLDKQYPHLREAVAKSCDFIGAIRLPNTAFKKNANTEVTTDIVFLRKRAPGEKVGGQPWRESRPLGAETNPIFLNEYYHAHPEMMLGRLERVEHGMYGREEVRLSADGRDLGEALAGAVAKLPAGVFKPISEQQAAAMRQTIPVPPGVKPNAYVLTNEGGGGIAVRDGDELRLLTDLPPLLARRIRRLIYVRDAARDCLRAQVENRPDAEVEAARFRLNQDYDYFNGQFGPVSHTANVRAFAGDPDLPLLLSLENYDDDTNTATKTAIFRERTIQRRQPVLAAGGAKEALVITLSEKGKVDLAHIGKLLGKSEAEFLPELQGALFLNPESQRWETDDDYLSGNVRRKLAMAEHAAKADARYRPNVEALAGVQPVDLTATEIDVRLGSAWIPARDVAAFAVELLHGHRPDDVRVHHAAQVGLWTVEVNSAIKSGVADRSEWGTARAAGHSLIEDALNLRTPTIFDYDDEGKATVNVTATESARDKQQKIKDRFSEWIWEEDARRERLVEFYNREFNHLRLRTFNGDHLTLPGASPTITLRPHQKAAVWRILQTPNALLAHVVGAGIMPRAGICRVRPGLPLNGVVPTRHNPAGLSQAFEEVEQTITGSIPPRRTLDGPRLCEDFLFQRKVCVQVDLGGFDRLVAQPNGDQRAVHPGLQQLHRGGVTQHMRRDAFFRQRRTRGARTRDMAADQRLRRIGAQLAAVRARKQKLWFRSVRLMVDPTAKRGHRGFGQGRAAFFPAFAFAAHMRPDTERDMLVAKARQLGEPQAGLHCSQQEGVVALSDPCGPIRDRQHGFDFRSNEEVDQRAGVPFAGDGQHTLDQRRVFRCFQCGIAEERADARQPEVAAARSVRARGFQVVEECSHERRGEIGEGEFRRRAAETLFRKPQQQPKRIAIGRDRVRARATLRHQPLREEAFQQ